MGGYFAGGLGCSLLLLALLAGGLLRMVKLFLQRTPWRIPTLTRQGLANLYRQGNQARAILVALGLGVMFTLTVYLVQHSLVAEIIETAPPGMPNVFLIGITPQQLEPLEQLIAKQPGVEATPEFAPSVPVQIASVNGVPFREIEQTEGRRFRASRSVMFADEQPPSLKVMQGAWWKKGEAQPVVSIDEEAARRLGVSLGDTLTISAAGKEVAARVTALHQVRQMRAGMVNELVFNPAALEDMPATFYGGVRMKPALVGALERAAYAQFPTVTVINVAEALAIMQQVVDQIAVVIRFLSAFAILAGAIILAASVGGHAFPARARSGDPENAGRDAALGRADFFGGVPHVGSGRRDYGRVAGVGFFEPAVEEAARRHLFLRLENDGGRRGADGAARRGLGVARQLPHSAAEAARSSAGRVTLCPS